MAVANRVILIGRLVRDPETKTTTTGKQMTRFTLAVDRRSKSSTQSADFIPIVTWDSLADICAKYLTKGRQVAVEGRLQYTSVAQPDGSKRTFFDVVADDMRMLGSRAEAQSEAAAGGYGRAQSDYQAAPTPDPLDEDYGGEFGDSNMEVPF